MKKLKKFEQYETDAQIDIERIQKLVNLSYPLLEELTFILLEHEDRGISIEYYNRIKSALSDLDDLKRMFK